jgi:hypothetical protein
VPIAEEISLAPWNGSAGEYNRSKAECERRLNSLIGTNLIIVRPGRYKRYS